MGITNSKFYEGLPGDKKLDFLKSYAEHPLVDYIDWEAFYRSEDGNEMNFVKALRTRTDEDGNKVYVLKEIVMFDEDYELIFISGKNEFMRIPAER